MQYNRLLISLLMAVSLQLSAQRVSLEAYRMPADKTFIELMQRARTNYIYPSGLLDGITVSISVTDQPLETALDSLFVNTPIIWTRRGNNIVLSRREDQHNSIVSGYVREHGSGEPLIGVTLRSGSAITTTNPAGFFSLSVPSGRVSLSVSYTGYRPRHLEVVAPAQINLELTPGTSTDSLTLSEVVVTADRNRIYALETTDVGRLDLSRTDIRNTPTMFGESDIIKTLQLQPGVSAGIEGLAGMYVHGGSSDENLYMLDNVPLYQVNHAGGLFSAFNTEAIKNVDFYKSTFPAKYNGRLSSIIEVHTRDGSQEGHHGSVRLGLTSAAADISGPILDGRTTYSVAVRRSWFEVLTLPGLAIYNSVRQETDTKTIAGYSFTDFNGKLTHRFSDRSRAHLMIYLGEDRLKGGTERREHSITGDSINSVRRDVATLRWGNLVVSAGWHYSFSPRVFGEFTAAYTRYSSHLSRKDRETVTEDDSTLMSTGRTYTVNNRICDWTLRADMTWTAGHGHRVSFGANGTLHSYMPVEREAVLYNGFEPVSSGRTGNSLSAREGAVYVGDDWTIIEPLRLSAGLNGMLYNIDGKTFGIVDPRASARWRISDRWTVKGAYARMSQMVHQLSESVISLPTDQWVPVRGDIGPQRSDKLSVGVYHVFGPTGQWQASVEGYRKWLHNLTDYTDDWYLQPADAPFDQMLCRGSGRAIGLDFMVTRRAGHVTGHAAYSLLWADRLFADKNDGLRFPARFDNRHKINIAVTWQPNDRWEFSAAWTGMSGNRMTLTTQQYLPLDPDFDPLYGTSNGYADMTAPINNFRLPFFHRLDLSMTRHTSHGYWNLSLYNAYCNLNAISVRRGYEFVTFTQSRDVFQIYRLLPIIPSFSYTWIF